MIKRLSADLIVSCDGQEWVDHHILMDGSRIEGVYPNSSENDIQKFSGVICPGFVNAHCHLELSHLLGAIDTGTGLIDFIKNVVTLREFPEELVSQAIKNADQQMIDNGIVAVGDISNKLDTFSIKESSPISYYTFVEMFDFLQEDQAAANFEQYHEVYLGQSRKGHNRVSCVPHAPYSVSKSLYGMINKVNDNNAVVSIHNQELAAENELFKSKSGGFIDFYKNFGIPLDQFRKTGQRSIDYAMSHMNPANHALMVHNTQTDAIDLTRATQWSDNVYWVTCPNANLYIENSLPRYQTFIEAGVNMCVGTDSLSSNWRLSILEEIKTIKKYQSKVADRELLKWATYNGAKALKYDDRLGSIARDKSPGINLIDVDVISNNFDLQGARSIRRLDL